MTAGEERMVEATNGLQRAVTIGLAGFILCWGLSYQVPDLAKKLTDPMHDKAMTEYIEAHPINYDALPKPDMPDLSNLSEEEKQAAIIEIIGTAIGEVVAKNFKESFDGYMKEVVPGLRKKEKFIDFGLLTGTGLLVALFGLAASAVWTAIQSRRLVGNRAGAVFRVVFPHADFNQPLFFSTRNFNELFLWTAGWLAAPFAIISGFAYVRAGLFSGPPLFGGLYPLAVILGSYYIFSFWLTVGIYARRGKLANPGAESVKFQSRALLFWFFFIYAPLLETPLDLIAGLLILIDFCRYGFNKHIAPALEA